MLKLMEENQIMLDQIARRLGPAMLGLVAGVLAAGTAFAQQPACPVKVGESSRSRAPWRRSRKRSPSQPNWHSNT